MVTYTVSDGNGGTATATLVIDVSPVNDPPVAQPDTQSVTENTAVSGNVLSNDTDPEGDTLSVNGFKISGDATIYNPGDTADIPGVGRLVIKGNGSYTFTPARNYNRPVPVATYTVTDGNGSGTGSLSLGPIKPVNDAPVISAIKPPASVDSGVVVFDLSKFTHDVDGDKLTFSVKGLPPGLHIDPNTGLVTGTLTNDASQHGPYKVNRRLDARVRGSRRPPAFHDIDIGDGVGACLASRCAITCREISAASDPASKSSSRASCAATR